MACTLDLDTLLPETGLDPETRRRLEEIFEVLKLYLCELEERIEILEGTA